MDGEWTGKIVGATIAIVIAVSLVPTVYSSITGTNTTGWSALTGGAGALAIFQLILLVFVAGIIVAIVKFFLS